MATGRKTVVAGQVIDPVGWGNPVWDQSVQTFASDADRTAQYPAAQRHAGAVTWLDDVKQLDYWDGAAWHALSNATDPMYLTAQDLVRRDGVLGQAVKSPNALVQLTTGLWRISGGAGVLVSSGTSDAVGLTLFNAVTGLELAGSRGAPGYLPLSNIGNLVTRPLYLSVPAGQTIQAQVVAVPNGTGSVVSMTPSAGGPSAWIDAVRIRPTP